MDIIKKIIFKKNSQIIILVAVILWACIQVILYPRVNSDTAFQIGQIQSFFAGKGFTIAHTFDDIAETQYIKNGDFAPGYLLVAAPLMYVFGVKIAIASIDIFSITVLFIAYFSIARLLMPYTNKFFLPACIIMMGVAPFLYQSCGATDLLSLAFHFLSIYLLIYFILNYKSINNQTYIFLIVALSLSAFLTCFFRYAYYPFLIIPPVVLLLYSFFYDKNTYKAFLLSTLFIIFLLSIQLYFQSGEDYISSRHGNSGSVLLHWANLKKFNNFLFSTFLDNAFFSVLLNKLHISLKLTYIFKAVITVALLVFLMWGIINLFRFTKIYNTDTKRVEITPVSLLFMIGAIVIGINLFFLIALSLRYELYDFGSGIKWTYVEENRYYAPAMVFVQLFILFFVLNKRNIVQRYVNLLCVLILITSLSINGLYQAIRINYSLFKNSYQLTLIQLPDLINKYKSLPAVILSSNQGASYTEFAMMGGATVSNAKIFFESDMRSTKPVHLFVAIPQQSSNIDLDNKLIEFVNSQKAVKIADMKAYGNTEIYYVKYQNM